MTTTLQKIAVIVIAGALLLTGLFWSRFGPPSLEDKIGQMLMVGFLGSTPKGKWARRVAEQIEDRQVGGVVFLGHNFKTKDKVVGLTKLFSDARRDIPAFVALDMEGGFVQRLGSKLGYEKIPPAQIIAETLSVIEAKKQFSKLATMTVDAGFNVNLGPVVDLLVSPDNPVVGKWQRSFGAEPEKVANYARAFVAAHREKKVMTVLKHFPGHGSSLSDSHDGFVDISQTWTQKELEPFQKLIESGDADAIMPGHLILDTKNPIPVSLSKQAIGTMLRGKLKFSGLVISDDLQMSAIRKNFKYEETLIMAINADVDILMISNSAKPDLDLPIKTIRLIKQAVQDNRIAKSTIDLAYDRILAAKNKLKN